VTQADVPRHVVIGRDDAGWCDRFVSALEVRAVSDPGLTYEIANLEAHDWLDAVRSASCVVWNPGYMGPVSASLFKERVFFLEHYLGKRVMPNYNSVWHFESKIAQSYLFAYTGVRTPATVASLDHDDAASAVSGLGVPVVIKESFGASSESVELLRTPSAIRTRIDRLFHQQLWDRAKRRAGSASRAVPKVMLQPWFWGKVAQVVGGGERVGRLYAQEFVEGNDADLRVTVVGSRAVAFWRHNRKNDFRASGSGLLDYDRPVPAGVVRGCMELSRKLGFDSMAYDILFRGDEFLVVEMSYGYLDGAVHDAPGSWRLGSSGDVVYVQGQVWPEELWIEHLLDDPIGTGDFA